ncbi:protein JTB isoform X2 [Ovis aries]|uniref:protein JTB isoform X2 n=1 Tax=Ovis aries TaxID=9940 RepID=UPI001C2ED652|nr:protein JTB isoform X2 [Ovis aries]
MPAGAGGRGLPQGHRLCWLLCAFTLRLCQAEAPVREEKLSVSTSNLPCWLVEEFVVAEECAPCSNFQAKTTPECGSTGYVEKITCSSSKRSEFKSCRSALMEQRLFWKFEGAVIGLALVFACLVIVRQRQLDRKALEKDKERNSDLGEAPSSSSLQGTSPAPLRKLRTPSDRPRLRRTLAADL